MTSISNHTPCCVACGYGSNDLVAERGWVRSNVRALRNERFEVWRCRNCASLHASEEVELAQYYAAYPFHKLQSDARMQVLYDNQVRRLTQAGLKYAHRILDYGCGSGAFVRHLRKRGFANAFGYDRFSVDFANEGVLERTYDVVLAQDVLEHVPEPTVFFSKLSELVAPGGIVAIGTPNAEALDLAQPERYGHALHLPYHRHIFSKRALVSAGERCGWSLIRYYPKQYANTLVPFLNASFYLYYMRLLDNTVDSLIEPPRIPPLLWRIPLTLFWGLFGYFLSEETDVMAVYRDSRLRPAAC